MKKKYINYLNYMKLKFYNYKNSPLNYTVYGNSDYYILFKKLKKQIRVDKTNHPVTSIQKSNKPFFKYKYIAELVGNYVYNVVQQLYYYNIFNSKWRYLLKNRNIIKKWPEIIYHKKTKKFLFVKWHRITVSYYRYFWRKLYKKHRRKLWKKIYESPTNLFSNKLKYKIKSFIFYFLNYKQIKKQQKQIIGKKKLDLYLIFFLFLSKISFL